MSAEEWVRDDEYLQEIFPKQRGGRCHWKARGCHARIQAIIAANFEPLNHCSCCTTHSSQPAENSSDPFCSKIEAVTTGLPISPITKSLFIWSRILLWKVTVPQLVKLPAFYRTTGFALLLPVARNLSLTRAWTKQFRPGILFFEVYFHIILSSTLRSFNFSLLLKFPCQETLISTYMVHEIKWIHPVENSCNFEIAL